MVDFAKIRREHKGKRKPAVDNLYCSECGGIHKKESDCSGKHYPACFCERCRGVSFDEWESRHRELPNGGRILTREEALFGEYPFDDNNETQTNQGEQDAMITVQRNNAPTGKSTPKGVQFLKPQHVIDAGGSLRLTITKVTTDKPDNYGNPYVVYFAGANGDKFSKGFKGTSYNLISLVDALDQDESKWKGKLVVVTVAEEEGQYQLRFAAAGK